VLRLLAAGTSRREAARRVFGSDRFKGRVDRILVASDRAADTASDGERARVTDGEEPVPALEELYQAYGRSLRRRLADPDERVTAGELLAFARLEHWVENKRTLTRLRELTRDPAAPGANRR
jgi:hypothetical protein